MNKLPEPYQHQIKAVKEAVMAGGNYAFFHDPGTCKTTTYLMLFSHYRKLNPDLRLFVVCPLSLIKSAWMDDIDTFFPEFTYQRYIDLVKKKTSPIPKDIVFINYELLIAGRNETIKRRVKREYFHLPCIIELLEKYEFMTCLDESDRLQTPKSITTKTLHSIRKLSKYKIIGTGTPWGISETEFWGQITFITNKAFHENFFGFRGTYFHLERGKQVLEGKVINKQAMQHLMRTGYKWAITPQKRKELFRVMAPYVSWVADTVLDLPPQRTEKRDVYLTAAETKAYKDMKNHLIVELKSGVITGEVALKKCMKLRQATSGFMYDEDKNTQRFGSSKTKILKEALYQLKDKQVLIWFQFTEELHDIMALLESVGMSYTFLSGEQKDMDSAVADFKHSRVQVCLSHPKSAAHGHTFIKCHTEIYYSMDSGYRYHKQGKKRIHRPGQEHPCLYIYLLASLQGKSPATIDHECMAVLEGRQTQQDIVMNLLKEGVGV